MFAFLYWYKSAQGIPGLKVKEHQASKPTDPSKNLANRVAVSSQHNLHTTLIKKNKLYA
jgi:hypothetical protein